MSTGKKYVSLVFTVIVLSLAVGACTAEAPERTPDRPAGSLSSSDNTDVASAEPIFPASTLAPTRPLLPTITPTQADNSSSPPDIKQLPTPIALPAGNIHQLEQPAISWIALDDTYIYWTTYAEPGRLMRYPLAGGSTEVVVTTQLDAGDLTTVRPIRTGEWLIFVDAAYPAMGTPYLLRAYNLQDARDLVLLDSRDGRLSTPFLDADGNRVVWTLTEHFDQGRCTESVLGLYDLATGGLQEIDRICTQDNYLWNFPRISGDYLVVEQDLPDSKGGGNNIVLHHLGSGESTALTNNGRSSMPDISGPWIAWKDSPRFEVAKRSYVYNLQTGKHQIIEIGYNGPSLVDGRWLYWQLVPFSPLYVYDLQRDRLYIAAAPGSNENLGAAVVSGRTAAWWRNLDAEHVLETVMLEWIDLPE